MRLFVVRTLSVVLLFSVFVLPVSLPGQSPNPKKPAPSSDARAVKETTLKAEGPALPPTPLPHANLTAFHNNATLFFKPALRR